MKDDKVTKSPETVSTKRKVYPTGVLDKALKDILALPKVIEEGTVPKTVPGTAPEKKGRSKGKDNLMNKDMQDKVIRLAEELFFLRSISGEAGISTDTIEREIRGRRDEGTRGNEQFALLFAYAQNRFIAKHQRNLMAYSTDKREKDWRAEAHILTLCDKEFSERKYLTDAVANQDAKIIMLIKAEQLTIATKQGKEMLKTVVNTPSQGQEDVSILPFETEDPKNKGKAKVKRVKKV